MKCKRCGQEIEADTSKGVVICGGCADDLRQEEEAELMAMSEQSKAEAEAQANREAYEESESEDDPAAIEEAIS